MSRKKNRGRNHGVFWQSAYINQQTYYMYRNWLWSIAMSRFRWINLPKTCDERFLELTLLTQGMATICTPKKKNPIWLSIQVAGSAPVSMYNNPSKWRALGAAGKPNFNCDWSNGVIIYDNLLRVPLPWQLDIWAQRLAAYDRTADINLSNQHQPWVMGVPQTKKQDAINLIKQIQGGEPGILGFEGIHDLANAIKIFNLDIPFIVPELQMAKQNLWSEIYTFLGISSLIRKNERMIEAEIANQNQPSEIRALDPLKTRREACKKLNERFNLNIDVVFNKDLESILYNYVNDLQQREANYDEPIQTAMQPDFSE